MAETALTFEKIWQLFQETDRKFQEMRQEWDRKLQESHQAWRREFQESQQAWERRSQETDRMFRETDKKMRALEELFVGQWGKLVESLVEGDLVNLLDGCGV